MAEPKLRKILKTRRTGATVTRRQVRAAVRYVMAQRAAADQKESEKTSSKQK